MKEQVPKIDVLTTEFGLVKGESKGHPTTGDEGPERE